MRFQLFDSLNGQPDYQWMKLWTSTEEPLDFSQYDKLVLSASFHPAAEWKKPVLHVTLELGCSALGDAWVESRVLIAWDAAWYTYERKLQGTFRQAQWQK